MIKIKELNKYGKLNFFTNISWITLWLIAIILYMYKLDLNNIVAYIGLLLFIFSFYTKYLKNKYKEFSDYVLNQSPIPIETRIAMSKIKGEPRKIEDLNSSLFLIKRKK